MLLACWRLGLHGLRLAKRLGLAYRPNHTAIAYSLQKSTFNYHKLKNLKSGGIWRKNTSL